MSLFSVFELHVYTCPDCLRILGSELCSSCLFSQHSSVMRHLQPYLKFCQPSLAKEISGRSYSIHYQGFPYVFREQQWIFLLEISLHSISQTIWEQPAPLTTQLIFDKLASSMRNVSLSSSGIKKLVIGYSWQEVRKKRFIINLTRVGKIFHTGLQI